ncbi:MAG: HAMP domain-containing sensor histidine kinase [Planctomycetia bacterium]|jgi:signal transduction histidine kinase
MSYRSIKRVLGETNLERKCLVLFAACLLVLITGSFWWYGSQTEELVSKQNPIMGRLLARQGFIEKHGVGLVIEPSKQPDPPLSTTEWQPPNENSFDDDWRQRLAQVYESINEDQYDWRIILPNRPDMPAEYSEKYGPESDRERELVEAYDEVILPPEEIGNAEGQGWLSEDGQYYFYYQPFYAKQSCFGVTSCHKQPLKSANMTLTPVFGKSSAQQEGELLGVARVAIPAKATNKAMATNRAFLITAAILTVVMAMFASYIIVRYVIVKPLKHLRDVSDAISHGNTSLRADIHTGDEFESLAVAFNRMLRHLITAQEELRHVNIDLDSKVDELARANLQLYELNRIKSDFLATMSHELRTPLNSILGFSDVLGAIDSLDDQQRRYVTNIQKSGQMLLEMINNILDLAKLESGRAQIKLSDFAIEQVISAQCDMARPLTERKNIDLVIDVQPNLPPIHQDAGRVQQILNNLLSNAIKFTPEGGKITVTAGRDEASELVLRVSDTGVGIAEDDIEAIFQKFRQGGNSLDNDAITREYSGTGLGLSIVKELCKLLGGEITAESRLGKGSTFTVRLPWSVEEQPRLDSPIKDEFKQFAQLRNDYKSEKNELQAQ